jgi:hypothetical protein
MKVKKWKRKNTHFRHISCPPWVADAEDRLTNKMRLRSKSQLWVIAFGLAYREQDAKLKHDFEAWLADKRLQILE